MNNKKFHVQNVARIVHNLLLILLWLPSGDHQILTTYLIHIPTVKIWWSLQSADPLGESLIKMVQILTACLEMNFNTLAHSLSEFCSNLHWYSSISSTEKLTWHESFVFLHDVFVESFWQYYPSDITLLIWNKSWQKKRMQQFISNHN